MDERGGVVERVAQEGAPPVDSAAPHGRPTWVRYRVLSWLVLAAVLAYLTRNAVGPAESSIRGELGISATQSGWFGAAFMWSYALMQIPGGLLAHYWGSRRALALMAATWSLAAALLGMAPWFGRVGLEPFWVLIFAQVLMGAAQAGIFSCTSNSISHWITPGRRSFATGCVSSGMQIGGIIAAVLTAYLLMHISWRAIFMIFAIPGLLWTIWFYFRFKDAPEHDPAVNAGELQLIRPEGVRPAEAIRERHEPTPWLAMAASLNVWCLCAQHFCRGAGYMFFAYWFPTFLQETRGVSIKDSGIAQSSLLIAALLGCLSGGLFMDWVWKRTGSLKLSRSGVASISQALCGLAILGSFYAGDLKTAVTLMAIGVFFTFLGSPAAFVVPIDIAGRHIPQTFAVVNMTGNFGAACSAIVVGRIFDRTENWNIVLLLFAGIYFSAAVFFALVNPNRPIQRIALAR